jgi:hypothetical protein
MVFVYYILKCKNDNLKNIFKTEHYNKNMSKWAFILKYLNLIEDEKDTVEHPFIVNYEKVLDSIYKELIYDIEGLYSTDYSTTCLNPFYIRHEKLIKHMENVEKTRMLILKRMLEDSGFEWYPLRLLEFDKWTLENGEKKGRKDDKLSITKYVEYLYQKNTIRMVNVNVKLFSGDVYNVDFDASKGIFDLERTLVSIDKKVFCYNHMKFFRDNEKEIPPYFKGKDWLHEISNGDVINVFISDNDKDTDLITAFPIYPKLTENGYVMSDDIIGIYIFYDINSVFKHDRKIYGFDKVALTIEYTKKEKTFYDKTNIIYKVLGNTIEDVLRYYEHKYKYEFTEKARTNLMSQWKIIEKKFNL